MRRRRRLPRILLNAATALSMVLCLAVAVAWAYAKWRPSWSPRYEVRQDGVVVVWRCGGWGWDPYGVGVFRYGWEFTYGPAGVSRAEANIWDLERADDHANQLRRMAASTPEGLWSFTYERTPPGFEERHLSAGRYPDGSNRPSTSRRLGGFALVVPFYQAFLLTAVLPAVYAGRRVIRNVLARRHRRAGHCPACGYDLRATPDRCPECGAVPLPPPTA